MGKIFMYSDQVIDENRKIDKKLLASFTNPDPVIAYIPCEGDRDRSHYRKQLGYYQKYGLNNLLFFDITEEYDEELLEAVKKSDAIHLSGGNPLIFRENLIRNGLHSFLIDYYHAGGTLIGVSGGAVQSGLSASLFDVFTNGLSNARQRFTQQDTLQLTPFEFLPHYNRWTASFKRSVEEFTELTGKVVYAADDGDGIVIESEELSFLGNIYRIQMGRIQRVS
ncbi:Type 1 glutamine amidotransferase-like domain-containing protein [Bacillus sp. SCS-153A]|uniref:Type 1 glutamine amidotransferase-like domain-containing protein n=1 Tax=Rossellomorea sedimentorum TaxID=3115294 RepID=UPI003905DAE2